MTVLSLLVLISAVASVILASEHARRCRQIEHIRSNVSPRPNVSSSLEALDQLRRRMRNAGRWTSIAAIYGGLALSAWLWAESVANLMQLTLGCALVAVLAVLFIESRSSKHRNLKGN